MLSATGPIGVFDSGYGGLTILDKIRELLPQYDYIYLGDNARTPYGTRSFEVVYEFTLHAREDKAARADKCKFFHKEHHPFSFLDGSSVSRHLRGGKAENCQISGHSCYTASRPYAILARGEQHESLL